MRRETQCHGRVFEILRPHVFTCRTVISKFAIQNRVVSSVLCCVDVAIFGTQQPSLHEPNPQPPTPNPNPFLPTPFQERLEPAKQQILTNTATTTIIGSLPVLKGTRTTDRKCSTSIPSYHENLKSVGSHRACDEAVTNTLLRASE